MAKIRYYKRSTEDSSWCPLCRRNWISEESCGVDRVCPPCQGHIDFFTDMEEYVLLDVVVKYFIVTDSERFALIRRLLNGENHE